jgi:flagellar hook-length control protein FliK
VDPSTISDSGSSGPAQPAEAPRSAAPQAPAPTPAPRQELSEADQQRLAEQALRGLKSVVNQRGGSLTLRLNPPDLGELRIRVELSPHAIRAQFEASSPQVASMLQRQMDTLRTALESQGLRVDHLQAQSPTAPAPTWQGAGEQAAGEDGQSKGMYQQQGGDQDAHSRRQDERDSPGKFERELLNLVA